MTNSNTVLLLEHKPTLSKRQQSEILYIKLISEGKSRKEIIQQFIEQIGLTEKGAPTYYANCKRSTNGGNFHTQIKKKVVEIEVEVDERMMYTVCTPINDEKYGKVVDNTKSFYSLEEANSKKEKDDIVVEGLPNVNIPFNYLKDIKTA